MKRGLPGLAVGLLLLAWCGGALAAPVPRYAVARAERGKHGPQVVVLALPHVTWRELRRTDLPGLHFIVEHGAIGLMQAADPESADPGRTWVTLGAGRGAVGDSGKSALLISAGKFHVDIAALTRANQEAKTHARPGALGQTLEEHGLRTVGWFTGAGAPTMLMDGSGCLDRLDPHSDPLLGHETFVTEGDPTYFEQIPGGRGRHA